MQRTERRGKKVDKKISFKLLNFGTGWQVLDFVAEEKEKDEVDDIDDVICVGREVPALELGAFRLRSFVAVPFETRNSSQIDAILSTPN